MPPELGTAMLVRKPGAGGAGLPRSGASMPEGNSGALSEDPDSRASSRAGVRAAEVGLDRGEAGSGRRCRRRCGQGRGRRCLGEVRHIRDARGRGWKPTRGLRVVVESRHRSAGGADVGMNSGECR